MHSLITPQTFSVCAHWVASVGLLWLAVCVGIVVGMVLFSFLSANSTDD